MTFRFCFITVALVMAVGCASKDSNAPANSSAPVSTTTSPATNASSTAPPVKSKIDACSLLTSDDIKAVQGEAYKDAQSSARQDGDFIVGQCYFALPTSVNSVVLNVTSAREGASTSARKFFQSTFAGSTAKSGEKEREREKAKSGEKREAEVEESPKPEKVTGLGEDAYWLASRIGGALYVLQGDEFFRISVGGAGDEKSKLAKSKTLAQKILKKLS